MSKLRKIIRIGPRDAANVARAYYYLGLAGWSLFVRRQHLGRWLVNPQDQPELAQADDARLSEAALWTNRAARIPFPVARCLQRSLALCLWLEHEGYKPSLLIGARRESAKLEAHAWVEYRGNVLNDRDVVKSMFPQLTGPAGAKSSPRP